MNDKDQRLAAAKRKLQEYKAQHRNETEKIPEIRRESQQENKNTNVDVNEIEAQQSEVLPNSYANGCVTLTIDDSKPSSRASPLLPEQFIPIVPSDTPTTIDAAPNTNANDNEEDFPETTPGLNISSEEDSMSTSNTNTSPVVTPNERSERASDVRQWVETDTLSKSSNQDTDTQPDYANVSPYGFYGPSSNSARNDFIHSSNQVALPDPVVEAEMARLSQNNTQLQARERELVEHLQSVEMIIQKLSQEKETLQKEITSLVPLKQDVTKLVEENTEFKVVVSDLRSQLNATLEANEASNKAFSDMQAAFIKVSNAKRDLESNWDIEQERIKMMEETLKEKAFRIEELVQQNQESVSTRKTIEAAFHVCEEELKELKNKNIILQKEIFDLTDRNNAAGRASQNGTIQSAERHVPVPESIVVSERVNLHEDSGKEHADHASDAHVCSGHGHDHSYGPGSEHKYDHSHGPGSEHQHEHSHGPGADHDHHHNHSHAPGSDHEHHDHSHDHDHSHAPGSDHVHDHHDHPHGPDHEHHNHEQSRQVVTPSGDGPSPMEKKLARLEWENLNFRIELDKLAANLKTKTVDADELERAKNENVRLHSELNRLDHLVIQLQGENDTIGDYISLYQTQKLVLKEKVREKDREMETLSRERAELRSKMEELNDLLRNYNNETTDEKPVQKINELITSINNSSATLHSCSVCSGTLLNV